MYRTGKQEALIRLANGVSRLRRKSFQLRWSPEEYRVSPDSEIRYQITLRDTQGLSYAETSRRSYRYKYKSWWDQLNHYEQAALAVIILLLCYLASCFILLAVHPAALLWLHSRLDLAQVFSVAPHNPLAPLLGMLLALSALNYFVWHPRTRRGWIARYRAEQADLEDLTPAVRKVYLAQADCLDAWIDRRIEIAREGFKRISTVDQRRVHIALPLRVGQREEGQWIDDPKAEDLAPLFEGQRTVVAILGDGGAGKSSLACQMARWVMAKSAAERLMPHLVIPLLLEDDCGDLPGWIAGELRRMVGEDEVEVDVVTELLRAKRLLVIVDALSERSQGTQEHVATIHGTAPVNALVVTARQAPNFGPTEVKELFPQPLTPEKSVYFVTGFLERVGAEELLPGRKVIGLADRLLALVEVGSERAAVTPLLVRLFIDQAIEIRRSGGSEDDWPRSIPEIVLDYVRRTNPQDPATRNFVADESLIEAARLLGWCSLGRIQLLQSLPNRALTPGDFYRDRALEILAATHPGVAATSAIDRLIANGVLRPRRAPVVRGSCASLSTLSPSTLRRCT